MFDSLPSVPRNAALDAVQRFFLNHGHDLAEAARLLGGVAAEAFTWTSRAASTVWSDATPELVVTDCGSEYISMSVRAFSADGRGLRGPTRA